ncbi:MAG TPA: DNA replication/repair protein RecF [Arenimonas sp.]|uniref:DNA replication/repair protein RecF n=1 Tax=Arenimonas sp. TaxID=1872635 RepID=UPI002BA5F843|nr:DNA replication/repair protein RecF [Arenimonas sp.]HMB58085.1 DNA replication/repair protein RecF [Arenimonas sp.]
MILGLLRISQLRCLEEAELELAPGLNLITGPNGAGKSSVIEALSLLGYGRSFRGRVRDGLIRSGQPHLSLYAEWRDGRGQFRRAGLRHTGSSWEARLDGGPVPSLTELCTELPVVIFEPGSHELIAGGSELRRRFLDWGLFHVEPSFLPLWRRQARALKQRNALLKTSPAPQTLASWDLELAEAGEAITRQRQDYLDRLEPVLSEVAKVFLPELGACRLEFQPGWKREALSLLDALQLARDRDLMTGHTSVGPHRADWQVRFAALPGREALSRGQEKLTALTCVLAQGKAHAQERGEWPVICLDDLASELDLAHQRQVLAAVIESGAQVLLTGTEEPQTLREVACNVRRFHVERGEIRRLPDLSAIAREA